jgi:predicted O-methyltransferase YrrM
VIAKAPVGWLLHTFQLRRADTQTTAAERACIAAYAAGRRRLVEIGVMHGASTRLLCEVMAPDGTLTAIDPFPAGRLGMSFEYAIARREVSRGPTRHVVWRRESSQRVGASWTGLLDFLFIDGDHSRRGIEEDWTTWSRFIEPGGVVLLHDSRKVEGRPVHECAAYTEEVIRHDPRFACIDGVETITVLERRDDQKAHR